MAFMEQCAELFETPHGTLADVENLPITFAIHADRDQKRHIANLAGPASLEYDAVQIR
jgi:hypothetical protein